MVRIFALSFLLLLISGCSKKYHAFIQQYQFKEKTAIPDYNSLDYWAAHPWKKDPSDSIPKPLRSQKNDSLVDVFFLHPTAYTDIRAGWNASVNDVYINAKTDYSSILYQASVFNQHCRIFAPRYRQAHISAFFINNDETRSAFDTAYSDIKRAFEFYLEHYNNNRPIIIAGHSQGALMAERLLKEFFDGKSLQQKLVVAYILVGQSLKIVSKKLQVVRIHYKQTVFAAGERSRRIIYQFILEMNKQFHLLQIRFHGLQPMNISV